MSHTPEEIKNLTEQMRQAIVNAREMDENHEDNPRKKSGDGQWRMAAHYMERLCFMKENSFSWEQMKALYENN